MRMLSALMICCMARAALACEAEICLVDPERLDLPRIITFEDTPAGMGPGLRIDDLLTLPGAAFGERFAGQSVLPAGDHDRVTGAALAPLTLMAGEKGRNLSVVFMSGNNVLNGYGAAGFPRRHAQGEGAMAFLFDEDQSALSFDVRGGEAGTVRVMFLRRDASVLATMDLPPAGEHAYGFLRADGVADIAGAVITNSDPQGIALDNLRFGRPPGLS